MIPAICNVQYTLALNNTSIRASEIKLHTPLPLPPLKNAKYSTRTCSQIYILIRKRWNSIKLQSNSYYCLRSLRYLDGLNGHHRTLFILGCCMNQHRVYILWESVHVKLGLRWSEIDLFCNSSAKSKWIHKVKGLLIVSKIKV